MNLRFTRREDGQDAAEAQCLLTERRSHPVVTRRRGVALVENQVDDFQNRRQPRGQLVSPRHLEWHLFIRECPLGPDDALRDGRLRDEERASDLGSGQASKETQRERDARVSGEHRATGRKYEPQEVVTDLVVQCRVEIGHGGLLLNFLFVPSSSCFRSSRRVRRK